MAERTRTELTWVTNPDPTSLRRAVRHALRRFTPGLRIVAEGFLAAETEIDLLGVDEHGQLVSVRIADSETHGNGFIALLSDLAWLEARADDLQKLAPDLDLAPGAAPLGILLSRDFAPETRLAITQLPRDRVRAIRYQSYRQRSQLCVGLLPDSASRSSRTTPSEFPAQDAVGPESAPPFPQAARSPTSSPAPSSARGPQSSAGETAASPNRAALAATDLAPTTGFRTGLTDEDLRVQSSEIEPLAGERSSGAHAARP